MLQPQKLENNDEIAIRHANPPNLNAGGALYMRVWSDPRADFVTRLVVLAVLVLIAYFAVFHNVIVSITEGSRAAYLLALPVQLLLIGVGPGRLPRGVSDAETDWILAGTVGGLALFTTYLTAARFPTLAALWNLPLISAVLWAGCAAIILFGSRRIWQVRTFWVFALLTVTPLPTMIITAALGGSNLAASAVAALLGAIAVFLAGSRSPLRWRLVASLGCASAGIAAAAAMATRPLPLSVAVSAGVIPVVCSALLYRFTVADRRTESLEGGLAGTEGSGKTALSQRLPNPGLLPFRSPITLTLLAAIAGIQMVLNTVFAGPAAHQLARAHPDWTSRAGLLPSAEFGFMRRYLGPDASFVRYPAPNVPGYPAAAVDVITAASLGALRTYSDVIWYPASVLPDYQKIVLNNAIPDALVLATDSSVATTPDSDNWYAVSWTWDTGTAYQRVFVVVNQTGPPQDPPPPNPIPPSIRNTIITPALWISRQQANPSTLVDPLVAARGEQVANKVIRAATAGDD